MLEGIQAVFQEQRNQLAFLKSAAYFLKRLGLGGGFFSELQHDTEVRTQALDVARAVRLRGRPARHKPELIVRCVFRRRRGAEEDAPKQKPGETFGGGLELEGAFGAV